MVIAEKIIMQSIRRDRHMQSFFATLGLLASIGMLYYFYQSNVFLFIVGGAILLGALVLIKHVYSQRKLRQHPVLKQLKQHPKEIVWVYAMVTERMPFGIRLSQSALLFLKK